MKKYDNYKDSGVEWLGLIPINWEVTKLKFVGSAIGGLTYSPKDVVEDESQGKLVLRSSNIQNGKLSLHDNVYVNLDISEKLTLKKGDILICSRNGSQHLIGKNICIDENTEGSTFGAFMMIFRSKYYGYLNHFFNSPIFTSQSGLFLTATINQLTSSTLNNFYLALPNSLEEQTAIANYLDHKTSQIDHLIAKKEQFIKLLEEERVAVINQAVTKGLDPNVPMKDSGVEWLGEIPEHWEVKRLGFLSSKIGDGLHGTPNYIENSEYKFINGNNIGNGQISIYEHTKCVSSEEYFLNKKELNENSILMSINGTIGNLGLYNNEKVMLGKSVAYINIIDSKVLYFTYKYLESDSCKTYIDNQLSGSTIKNLSLYSINKIPIPFPSFDEQSKIVDYISLKTNEINILISKTHQEIILLKEYKTALISEVITGKVDVR